MLILGAGAVLIWLFVFTDYILDNKKVQPSAEELKCPYEPTFAVMGNIKSAKLLNDSNLEVNVRQITVENPFAGGSQDGKLIVFPVSDNVVVW